MSTATTINLQSNVFYRITRLPKPTNEAQALQPLFEALMNSFQAIEENSFLSNKKEGRIVLTVDLEAETFSIEDNGIGLNEENWQAFCTEDTPHKIDCGGKGVGRLLWLDCFEDIFVTSVYRQAEGCFSRNFKFSLSHKGQITEHHTTPLKEKQATGCNIIFKGLRDNGYKEFFPKKDYRYYLLAHFLPLLLQENAPNFVFNIANKQFEMSEYARSLIIEKDLRRLSDNLYGDLDITLLKCKKEISKKLPNNHSNFIHLIADNRTVLSESIDNKLGFRLIKDKMVAHIIVGGAYLDKHVNQERLAFNFSKNTLDDLKKLVFETTQEFLKEEISSAREFQNAQLKKTIQQYPTLRIASSSQEMQNYLPPYVTKEEDIYKNLSVHKFRLDKKLKEKSKEIIKKLNEINALGKADLHKNIASEARDLIEELDAHLQKDLAQLVLGRQLVLEVLEELTKSSLLNTEEKSYHKEQALHNLICPLRIDTVTTEKKIDAYNHNMWIIDERLTFSQYISSDKPIKNIVSDSDCSLRPDLVVYDKIFAYEADQKGKILLVEFKRPGREDYEGKSPEFQIIPYIKQLKGHNIKSAVDGSTVNIPPDAFFNCYLIADIIGEMETFVSSWIKAYGDTTRIKYLQGDCYGVIHAIGWSDLLANAKLRNKIFIDKLSRED